MSERVRPYGLLRPVPKEGEVESSPWAAVFKKLRARLSPVVQSKQTKSSQIGSPESSKKKDTSLSSGGGPRPYTTLDE